LIFFSFFLFTLFFISFHVGSRENATWWSGTHVKGMFGCAERKLAHEVSGAGGLAQAHGRDAWFCLKAARTKGKMPDPLLQSTYAFATRTSTFTCQFFWLFRRITSLYQLFSIFGLWCCGSCQLHLCGPLRDLANPVNLTPIWPLTSALRVTGSSSPTRAVSMLVMLTRRLRSSSFPSTLRSIPQMRRLPLRS
jgi:hypothetical protein